jgi:hypothetical protein
MVLLPLDRGWSTTRRALGLCACSRGPRAADVLPSLHPLRETLEGRLQFRGNVPQPVSASPGLDTGHRYQLLPTCSVTVAARTAKVSPRLTRRLQLAVPAAACARSCASSGIQEAQHRRLRRSSSATSGDGRATRLSPQTPGGSRPLPEAGHWSGDVAENVELVRAPPAPQVRLSDKPPHQIADAL